MQAIISLALCSSRKYPYSHLPTEGNGNSEGRGDPNFRGVGGGLSNRPLKFFPGAPSKIDEQSISYFTINRCCKANIIVFIDDLLFAVC